MRVRFAGIVFDGHLRELSRAGHLLPITPKAFALLEMLLDAAPAPVAKDDLYQRLWPGLFVEPGNLHNLISELRSAMGDDTHTIIRTAHRFGYALDVPLDHIPRSRFELVIGTEIIPLAEGKTLIGRDLIGAPDVSRRHAVITIEGETATIEDLGSKNGTWVGGRRIESALALPHGDEILLGRRRIVLRLSQPDNETITASTLTGSRG
jgi:DNA-binding winged helix-turn-helix (wHTH) protein